MSTIKKNKFQESLELSNKEIKGKRAALFAQDAEIDSKDYIRGMTDTQRALERKLMNLEDFHADSTTTLKVTTDGFNSKEWIKNINETTVQLKLLNVKIDVAKEIHDKYFM